MHVPGDLTEILAVTKTLMQKQRDAWINGELAVLDKTISERKAELAIAKREVEHDTGLAMDVAQRIGDAESARRTKDAELKAAVTERRETNSERNELLDRYAQCTISRSKQHGFWDTLILFMYILCTTRPFR